jgi:hypothetical protein
MISREEVLRVLDYDEFTGVFTWKVSRGRGKVGSEAGCVSDCGTGKFYRRICVSGKLYHAHRLAWLIINGMFPENEIDHVDGNGLNNKYSNLRSVTHSENAKNKRKHITNTSGVVGVSWYKSGAKWQASIRFNGKLKHLGLFESFDDAVIVRKEAEKLYNFHPGHGMERPL